MGKTDKWRDGHSPKKVSEGLGRVQENEKKNPTRKDTHKEVKKNKDGSTRYIY
jgi:hypothetical protein